MLQLCWILFIVCSIFNVNILSESYVIGHHCGDMYVAVIEPREAVHTFMLENMINYLCSGVLMFENLYHC
jgi:hypothetical protein